MHRVLGLAILVVGILLLFSGISATHQVKEEFIQSITGQYTDKTTLLLIFGVFMTVVGTGLIFFRENDL